MTLPTGANFTYGYDGYHNVTSATSATGVASAFVYDTKGLNTAVKVGPAAKPIEANAAYSSNGRTMSSTTNPLRKTTSYSYDNRVRLTNTLAPGETAPTRTNYVYDTANRITSVTKSVPGLPVTVSNAYTYENDRIKTLTHSNTGGASTVYTFNYGAFGLPTSTLVGQRTLITNTYDISERTFNLMKATYGNGAFVQYSYDSHDRITGIRYNGDAADRYTFKYDNCGRLGLIIDAVNKLEIRYTYDFAGRLVRLDETGFDTNTYTHRTEWTYDDLGRMNSRTEWVNDVPFYGGHSYDNDNRLAKFHVGSTAKDWSYDTYSRPSSIVSTWLNKPVVNTALTYIDPDSSHTSAQIAAWHNRANAYDKTYTYAYDDHGNIASITDGSATVSYTYDLLGQLTRENNPFSGKTWVFTYDAGGNILSRTEYAYTTGPLSEALDIVNYAYADTQGWKDLLTSYNGQAFSYDAIGNLLNDGTWSYTWQGGRSLTSMQKSGTAVSYSYGSNGIRLSKTVNGVTTRYTYSDGHLVHVEDADGKYPILFDASGHPVSMIYTRMYFFIYSAQGDVVGLANPEGNVVVEYTYDAWGNPLSCTGSMASSLGKKNPFRYRGYVYDEETGLYYLKSRYYNPRVGRFVCADHYAMSSFSFTGANMFAYCGNNPIIRADHSGTSWDAAWEYHKLRQEYAQMSIPYPGTAGSHIPDKSGYFEREQDAATHWAIVNRPLSEKRERGAFILYNPSLDKFTLGSTFVGNNNTVAGGFIGNYLGLITFSGGSIVPVSFIHSHPDAPDGCHNDFPSYSTSDNWGTFFANDMLLLNLPGVNEVYIVPYKSCTGVPSIIVCSDRSTWDFPHKDSKYEYGFPPGMFN